MKGNELMPEQILPCAICGTPHTNVEDRMVCEQRCYAELQRKKRQERMEELNKNKQMRIDEIDSIGKLYREKVDCFRRDYGANPIQQISDIQLVRNIFDTLKF